MKYKSDKQNEDEQVIESRNPIIRNLEASSTRCFNCGHNSYIEGELDQCMCICHRTD